MPRGAKTKNKSSLRPRGQRKTTRKQKVRLSPLVIDQDGRAVQVLDLGSRRVPLVFQPNKRARRIILRVDHESAGVVVVLPARASREEGRRFALANEAWIRDRLAKLPPRVRFRDGAVIPFMGVDHVIRHRPRARGTVWREDGEIHVAGRIEHLSRRVEDWLRQQIRREVERRSMEKAAEIGKAVKSITIRDPKSRWASCAADGKLAFSWRLVFAPRAVIDYVVAHEVAHLREMNHGPRFWRLCESLTRESEWAKTWMGEQGPALHRFG